jgi:hypothetical protein
MSSVEIEDIMEQAVGGRVGGVEELKMLGLGHKANVCVMQAGPTPLGPLSLKSDCVGSVECVSCQV